MSTEADLPPSSEGLDSLPVFCHGRSCQRTGSQLGALLFAETGITGTYSYSAFTKPSGSDAAFDLAHQPGLELAPVKRPVDVLAVSSIGGPAE